MAKFQKRSKQVSLKKRNLARKGSKSKSKSKKSKKKMRGGFIRAGSVQHFYCSNCNKQIEAPK